MPKPARVAVVHDYLTQRGGAERVVLAILAAFPEARVFTSVYHPETTYPEFARYDITTSSLNRVPAIRRDPRRALPLLARAFSGLAIEDADVVVCSSSGWAHGVTTTAPKIVYCHNTPRWLYQTSEYAAGERLPVRLGLELMRRRLTRWDQRAAASAAMYLANSSAVRDRIAAAYGIEAEILHPPVAIDIAGPQEPIEGLVPGFLLTVSRSRGYKNAAVAAEAVTRMPGERLVIVGELPAHPAGGSWPDRIRAVRDVSEAQLRWLYAHGDALLGLSHEDFGLTPLEANAFGTPALCLRAGGYLDSQVDGVSGLFVERLTVDATIDAIRCLRTTTLDARATKDHSQQFGAGRFRQRLHTLVQDAAGRRTIDLHQAGLPAQRRRIELTQADRDPAIPES